MGYNKAALLIYAYLGWSIHITFLTDGDVQAVEDLEEFRTYDEEIYVYKLFPLVNGIRERLGFEPLDFDTALAEAEQTGLKFVGLDEE